MSIRLPAAYISSDPRLAESFRYCKRVARKTGRNFYYSFLVLPAQQRQAMCALYTFMRKTDDLGDCDLPVEVREKNLNQWRADLDAALSGRAAELESDRCWPALAQTVEHYDIPPQTLHAVIDGCISDLSIHRYETFEELYRYCYQVASAVGLACIRIWGVTDPRADIPAEKCGIAFQLTNILRDIREDLDRGRVYLPQEDLRQFHVTVEDLATQSDFEKLEQLLRFQIRRAEEYYAEAEEIYRYLPPAGQAIQKAMMDIYHGLLVEISCNPVDVFRRRISLSPARKLLLVATALPRRFLPVSFR